MVDDRLLEKSSMILLVYFTALSASSYLKGDGLNDLYVILHIFLILTLVV